MAEIVTHNFTSAKADSADATIVSSSEWNDGHSFAGGADGNLIVRDSTQAKGAKYIQGPNVTEVQQAYSGAAPSPELCSTVIVFTTNAKLILFGSTGGVTNNASAYIIDIRRDGVSVFPTTVEGATGLNKVVRVTVLSETPGTHTYSLRITTSGGATMTSSGNTLHTFSIGSV